MKLWSINRALRWSGFRLVIFVDDGVSPIVEDGLGPRLEVRAPVRAPSRIDLRWVGFPGSEGWARWEPHNRTPIRSLFRKPQALPSGCPPIGVYEYSDPEETLDPTPDPEA